LSFSMSSRAFTGTALRAGFSVEVVTVVIASLLGPYNYTVRL
jgi:hypothetical protein